MEKSKYDLLIEAAAKDRKKLKELKLLAVFLKQYEFAADLRKRELELHPETEEVKQSKEFAKKLNLVFRMVDLNIDEQNCLLLYNTIASYILKGEKFSIDDACEIQFKNEEIFG